jgi:hypothetical protein
MSWPNGHASGSLDPAVRDRRNNRAGGELRAVSLCPSLTWEVVVLSRNLSALVALSLISASGAAAAAQPLSLANAPAAARADGASNLDDRNGITIYIIGAVVLGLIIWGIIELTKDDEGPTSP